MNARPTAILWDWDNTLVDGWAAIEAGLNAAFRAFGLPEWDRTQVLANVRRSLRESFPPLFGAEWEKAREIFYAEVRARHLDVVVPIPGAAAALAAAGRVARQGVVSNKQGPLLRAEAVHLGWAGHFGALVGAGDAVRDKPDAAPLLMALEALGVPPSPEVWYVGDTALDMQAARAAGCRAVLLGDAAHDGGIAAAAPDAFFADGHALEAGLLSLAIR
ncbi:HAD family hydrolase [Neoroseomonas soli]|uniref:phosphoglycolate phosphatase n=1 Tax=Neoroseomonas soli TaxID=1081025 RepID=A0A9X9X135_9PROT|nr:HAD family hydrolase [Neoroseomonas soli]MBR0673114.1 HAD family hydrolase [Neoroseomonas soli]